MIFLKDSILVFSFVISIYIGFEKSKQYVNRVKELKQFENALEMFKAKINFTYEPIKEIFKNISASIYENKENIFINVVENIKYEDITKIWQEKVDDFNSNLNKEDKETIKMFGKLLGKTDKNGQISEILLCKNSIENQIQKAEDEKQKNVKLYRSLGLIVGFAIIIIFI